MNIDIKKETQYLIENIYNSGSLQSLKFNWCAAQSVHYFLRRQGADDSQLGQFWSEIREAFTTQKNHLDGI